MTVNPRMKGLRTMTRSIFRALGLAGLFAVMASSAWAGSGGRKGTGGASELLIPVGARGSALGAGVASDVSGAEAIYWNPAGVARLEGTDGLFSHTTYFADMKVNYAALAIKAGGIGVLGFNAKVLSVGDVIVTTEAAPDGTGEIVEPTFTVLGLTWAKAFTDRVNFGITTNFVSERLLSMSASGLAFDFGVQYDTGWRGLKLGMAMKNFGNSMSFNGENLEVNLLPPGSDPTASNRTLRFTTANFEMPSYFTLSGTYDLYHRGENHLKLMGAFQNNNFLGDNLGAGAEWGYKDMFALRGSWFGTGNTDIDAAGDQSVKFSSGDDLYQGVALGAGVKMKTGGTNLGVDVSWRPVKNFFDDVLEFGLRLRF